MDLVHIPDCSSKQNVSGTERGGGLRTRGDRREQGNESQTRHMQETNRTNFMSQR